jgi:hypothetical protein
VTRFGWLAPARWLASGCTWVLLVLAPFTPWAGAEAVSSVAVEGVGAIGIDLGAARDEAIRDAMRRAVEQVVGVAIQGRTLMVDYLVVEDRVVARSAGFVRAYEVLEERRDGDLYRVRIMAQVDSELLIDDLEGFGALVRLQLGNPRVLVVAQAPADGTDDGALRLLSESFVARRFHVLSAEQVGILRTEATTVDRERLIAAARASEAELVVSVATGIEPLGVRPTSHGEIHSVRATVSLQAILARTGQVVAAQTAQATRVSVAAGAAGADAVALAVAEAFEPFTLAMVQALNASVGGETSTTSVRLVVGGIDDYSDVLLLRSTLQQVRGVVSLQQREFSNGSASFDLQGSVTTDDLAVRLMALAGLPLSIRYVDAQRIEAVRVP